MEPRDMNRLTPGIRILFKDLSGSGLPPHALRFSNTEATIKLTEAPRHFRIMEDGGRYGFDIKRIECIIDPLPEPASTDEVLSLLFG